MPDMERWKPERREQLLDSQMRLLVCLEWLTEATRTLYHATKEGHEIDRQTVNGFRLVSTALKGSVLEDALTQLAMAEQDSRQATDAAVSAAALDVLDAAAEGLGQEGQHG